MTTRMHPFLNVGATVHWKVGDGRALCSVTDSNTAAPGDWLSRVEAEVDCRECIELRHS